MDHFLQSSLNLLQYCFLFYVFIFWPWGMWDLSSPTKINPESSALEGKVYTIGQAESPPTVPSLKSFLLLACGPEIMVNDNKQWLHVTSAEQGEGWWPTGPRLLHRISPPWGLILVGTSLAWKKAGLIHPHEDALKRYPLVPTQCDLTNFLFSSVSYPGCTLKCPLIAF